MSRKHCYRGEINIFYFFLVALSIHLLLFVVKQYDIKGEANLNLKTTGAPVSVQFKSATLIKPRPSIQESKASETTAPEPKVEPKKEIKKEEFQSKVKDVKKEKVEKKIEKKKVEMPKKEVKKPNKDIKKENSNNVSKATNNATDTDPNSNQDFLSGNFSIGTDGTITAASSEGIEYHIIKQPQPTYPIQAKKIRYNKIVSVKVKFLVDLNGDIKNIEILKSHSKLGFDKAVIDALNEWQFKPIFYKNKNIKMYFTKEFVFENKE